MLKDLLKQQILLRQKNQSLSKEISCLKQRIFGLEESLLTAYRWPLDLKTLFDRFDDEYTFQVLQIPKSAQSKDNGTILSMNQVALIKGRNQSQEFYFTKPQRLAAGGVHSMAKIRLGDKVQAYLHTSGLTNLHFYELKKGVILNVGLFDLEKNEEGKFELTMLSPVGNHETSDILSEVLREIGPLRLSKNDFMEWNSLKSDREKLDSLQKQSFHSRFKEALEVLGHFR